VSVVCCQVEVSALSQKSHVNCNVSGTVLLKNSCKHLYISEQ
jgi:hypothetical protein